MAFDPALQAKLDALWFILPSSTPAGTKAARQKMLVREFQIAARERYGAQDSQASGPPDAARLQQVELQQVDPVAKLADDFIPHGDPEPLTLAAIDAWLAGTARLRSPVVFQARDPGSHTAPWQHVAQQAFCFHDELQTTKPRVFALDYTGRYPLNPNGQPPLVPVGTAVHRKARIRQQIVTVYGPASKPPHSLTPFDPEHVVGRAWSAMSQPERSTFRVTAALAQVEAGGIFDGLNAYDTSVFSAGPYHYTGFPADALGAAELGAFLAYFSSRSATQYDAIFTRMGVAARQTWSRALFNSGDGTYRAELGFVDPAGGMPAPTTLEARNWLRTWPSLYRIQAALRNSPGVQGAVWPFARQRINDVLTTPWGAGAPPGATTLGDVFKSERTVGSLVRWHIFRPRHIVDGGQSGVVPGRLVSAAGLTSKAVGTWRDADEIKLAAAFAKAHTTPNLAGRCAPSLATSLATLASWSAPAWSDGLAGPLLRLRRDFALFTDGIPFPTAALGGDT
ncbi:hypothetical protein NKI59_26875 [Mesorhizobium sp. M0598]|uniref:hypothetical protein n=1 Tax=Mesorhizobium sp. M0598 TaxID=2956968 RepID=UPI0033366E44